VYLQPYGDHEKGYELILVDSEFAKKSKLSAKTQKEISLPQPESKSDAQL